MRRRRNCCNASPRFRVAGRGGGCSSSRILGIWSSMSRGYARLAYRCDGRGVGWLRRTAAVRVQMANDFDLYDGHYSQLTSAPLVYLGDRLRLYRALRLDNME